MSLCFIKSRCASEPESKGPSLWVGVNSYLVNEFWPLKAVDWIVATWQWAALSVLGDDNSVVLPSLTRAPALDLAAC